MAKRPIRKSKVEYLTPLPESSKALHLTKEMDDACLDLTLDFKAGGRPKQVSMRQCMHQRHERNILSIM
jgi:hypothetical protein